MSTISTIGTSAFDQARLRIRLEELTRQVSTGQKGPTFGALGTEAKRGIDLRGDIARREAYLAAADAALGRMGAVQSVLSRLQDIAGSVAAEASRARTLGTTGVDALGQTARGALEEVAALLNTQSGGEYLFAGSDIASAPVPNAAAVATGPFAAAVATQVGSLTPLNAATVLANTAGIATVTSPFNAFLEGAGLTEPRRALQAADGERIAWGVIPTQDSGGNVATSWARELMRGLATLAAVTTATALQGQGYDDLLAGVAQGLTDAARGAASEQGALGAAEKRLQDLQERHRDMLGVMRAQVISVEQVDLADASASLKALQLRLEASYETTSGVARLSLAALLR
ncbi:flagellin [Falsiroseomonas sp. HW251]|uniref:flagellin n=1 Tax=Falsiroseomonas sp. HW251 TaxID=3390998 RepID=UPI003D319EB0